MKDLQKPIYEKEMLEILHALKQWQPYLMGRHFEVKKKITIVLNTSWNKYHLQKNRKNG